VVSAPGLMASGLRVRVEFLPSTGSFQAERAEDFKKKPRKHTKTPKSPTFERSTTSDQSSLIEYFVACCDPLVPFFGWAWQGLECLEGVRLTPREGMATNLQDRTDLDLLTATEACVSLRCGRRTIGRLVAAGDIPFVKFGNRLRFKREAISRFIEARETRINPKRTK
jgi:excisionase family DNA binding protein